MAVEAFVMPDEYKGKSPEELVKTLLDTRKEYDTTKSEYEKYKGEWDGRAKQWSAYSELGDPDKLAEVVKWGKTVAGPLVQSIAEGKARLLKAEEAAAYDDWLKNKDKTSSRTEGDDDIYAPVRKNLREELMAELTKVIDERAKGFDANVKRGMEGLNQQQQLFAHVIKLKQQYPSLDIDAVLNEGAEMASLPADKLLEKLIQSQLKNSTMDAEIEKRVAAKLGEKTVDDTNAKVTALLDSRRTGQFSTPGKFDRRASMKNLVETLQQKHPTIFEHLPIT